MVGELADLRTRPPWEPAALTMPIVVVRGERGAEHHRIAVEHLGATIPHCALAVVDGAKHFGPNTHPDAVAAVVATLVSRVG